MNRRTRQTQIGRALDMIEALGPDVTWTLSTARSGYDGFGGPRVMVTIRAHGHGTTVHEESSTSFVAAAERAITRLHRRIAGDPWA